MDFACFFVPEALKVDVIEMLLTYETICLDLKHTFRISRESSDSRRNVICRIQHEGVEGLGEAAPSAYYGQSWDTVVAAMEGMASRLGQDPFALEALTSELARLFPGEAAARAAVDMAMHDIVGKKLGLPLYRLWGLDPDKTPQTSVTVGIDTIEMMKQKVVELGSVPILKIKLGTQHDLEIIEAIRQMTAAVIRVDANAAWKSREAMQKISRLEEYGVEFVEQPLAADDLEGLRWLKKRVDMPIILDESVRTAQDIPALVDCAHGINIKLMKCGGLREALRMIHAARAHGLQVMLGCMVETSLAITAAAQLSPLADYADLDGHLLIRDDPFAGVEVVDGKLVLPERSGIGVVASQGRGEGP
jgi:L-alanine-DL-glutamate epimerase-like enolase superfamily enzyme